MSRTENLELARERLCELRSRLSGVASEGILDLIDDAERAATRAYEDKDLEITYEWSPGRNSWQFYANGAKLLEVATEQERDGILARLNQVAVEAGT